MGKIIYLIVGIVLESFIIRTYIEEEVPYSKLHIAIAAVIRPSNSISEWTISVSSSSAINGYIIILRLLPSLSHNQNSKTSISEIL